MSSLYTHIPSLENLKEEIDTNGLEKTIEYYSKYEWLIGDSDAIKYLEEKNEEFKKLKNII
jgi:hypothetical protein